MLVVKAKLFVRFGFNVFAAKQRSQPIEQIGEHRILLRGAKHLSDSCRQRFPRIAFGFELLLALACERVELCAAIVFGGAPFRGDPSLAFKAMQRGVERALLHAENVVRDLLEPFGNGPAMLRLVRAGAKNQQVEGSLRQFEWWGGAG